MIIGIQNPPYDPVRPAHLLYRHADYKPVFATYIALHVDIYVLYGEAGDNYADSPGVETPLLYVEQPHFPVNVDCSRVQLLLQHGNEAVYLSALRLPYHYCKPVDVDCHAFAGNEAFLQHLEYLKDAFPVPCQLRPPNRHPNRGYFPNSALHLSSQRFPVFPSWHMLLCQCKLFIKTCASIP